MIISRFFRTLARRWRHERGAVLVEAAIAIPILLLLILGSVEAGTAWNAKSSTTSGLRSGLLRAATLGDEPETDLRVLQSIVGEVGADNVNRLEWVMIYDASANGGNQQATISACQGNGTPGECVFYPTAVLETISTTDNSFAFHQANFDQGSGVLNAAPFYTCSTGLDSQWCAASRPFQADGSRADVQIGVALRYQHEWFTGIFPGNAPVFNESGVSSTFQEDGAQINASTPFAGPGAALAYENNFNGLVGGAGTITSPNGTIITDQAGSGRTIFGLFDKDSNGVPALTVEVDNLPTHSLLCVSFDLVIFGGWEEAGDPFNPTGFEDVVWVTVDNANTSGSNEGSAELFRGTYDQSDLNTGGTFQYTDGADSARTGRESVVTVNQCVNHVAGDAQIDFRSIISAQFTDESWAIEKLKIETR